MSLYFILRQVCTLVHKKIIMNISIFNWAINSLILKPSKRSGYQQSHFIKIIENYSCNAVIGVVMVLLELIGLCSMISYLIFKL